EANVVSRHEEDARRPRRSQHLVGFGQRARDRLLDENVLAGRRRGHRDRCMQHVGRADVDRVHVVPSDDVPPVVDDVAPRKRGPCRFRGSAAAAGEGDDVGAGPGEGGEVGPAGDGPAADERDAGTHDSTWAATLRTAVATSSQSAAVKAAPTPTENDRAASASLLGHIPMRYSTWVGCSAQCHGPPLPDAVRRSRMAAVAYTGRPPYIWADGYPPA